MLIVSFAHAKPWKSAELITYENFKYGAYEARLRAASGSGLITTFFLWRHDSELPDVEWKEMDFEIFGKNGEYQTQIMTPNESGGRIPHRVYHAPAARADEVYHTYRMEWTPEHISFYVDGVLVRKVTDKEEFAKILDTDKASPMNIRLGVWAANSNWSGPLAANTEPAAVFVNWFKVYDYSPGSGDNGTDFKFRYVDNFDYYNYSKYYRAQWTFDASKSDYIPENVLVKDGKLVLSFTPEGQSGWSGDVPADEGNFTDDLVAHWKMKDGSGTQVTDSVGGYHGTLSGGSWSDDNAVEFDGGKDKISIPSEAFNSIDDEFTISMWVNGNSGQPVADSVFYALDNSNNRAFNIHLPWANSVVYWDAGNSGSSYSRISKLASKEHYEGGWNQWVFTKNSTSGEMQIFVNGELFHSAEDKTAPMSEIKAAYLGGTKFKGYKGLMGEVRFYNRVLPAIQIEALFNNDVAAKASIWEFENFSSNQSYDAYDNNPIEFKNVTQTTDSSRGSKVLNFNGSNAEGEIPTTVFNHTKNEISIALWSKGGNNLPKASSVLRAVNSAGERVLNIHLPWANSTVYWDAGLEGTKYDRISKVAPVANYKNAWSHWVFTKNTTTGSMKIFLNGALWHSGTGFTKPIEGINEAFIGSGGGTLYYSGQLDNLDIYNVELTSDEVLELYQATK